MKSTRALAAEFRESPGYVISMIELRCEAILWRNWRSAMCRAARDGSNYAVAIATRFATVRTTSERLTKALQSRDVPGAEVIVTAAKARFLENCKIWKIAGR